jgi:hypothetical protein
MRSEAKCEKLRLSSRANQAQFTVALSIKITEYIRRPYFEY